MARREPLYKLLEVDPGASDEELRRAYKRLTKRFDPDSGVVYGLYRPDELEQMARQLAAAYDTLVDPELRRRYDLSLFPEGHPSLRRADQRRPDHTPLPGPPPPDDPLAAIGHPVDRLIDGPTLTRLREVCHLTLQDVSDRTKISMFALRCIEAEQYADLPAAVYLRGFLRQIAGSFRIDAGRVISGYMKGFEAWSRARESSVVDG